MWGSKAAGLMERLLGPIAIKDGSGVLGLLRLLERRVPDEIPSMRVPDDEPFFLELAERLADGGA